MTERKNIPAVITAQAVAVLSEQRGSLVARGLAAVQESKKHELIRNSQDALYRQARTEFEFYRGRYVDIWRENKDPALFSAFKIFQQLANESYGKAYYPLSILYGDKREIEEGKNRAQYFAQLAFDWCFANQTNQDHELWCDLAAMYRNGFGIEQNAEQAVYWFRKAAAQGSASAQGSLGEMCGHGEGVSQDYEEAVKWYRLAAGQSRATAQTNLGVMYCHGIGVPQDYEEAKKWFRLAVEHANVIAQINLGVMYRNGRGVPQDHKKAVKWFHKAADQGSASAQGSLGVMYSNGEGVPQDYEEAMKWFRLAADQGNATAQYNLGVMYRNGEGVPQDDEDAVKWFLKAAGLGNANAHEALRKLGIDWKK